MNNTETINISPEQIAGFTVQRSLCGWLLFNVFAVDANGNSLFCAASDLSFEKASAWVDAINAEHYPYVPTPTELVEVQIANEKNPRFYKAVK